MRYNNPIVLFIVLVGNCLLAFGGASADSHDDTRMSPADGTTPAIGDVTGGYDSPIAVDTCGRFPSELAERGVTRACRVRVPADFFRTTRDDPVSIDLGGGRVIALVEKKRRAVEEITYVVGEVQDAPYSRFVIQLQDGVPFRGEIRLFNEVIDLINPRREADEVVFQLFTVDPTQIPAEEHPVEHDSPGSDRTGEDSDVPEAPPPGPIGPNGEGPSESDEDRPGEADELTEIEVLFVYTEAAKEAVETFFSPLTIDQVIADQVVWANFGLEDQAGVTLIIAGIEPVSYVETNSIAEDLTRLQCPCDHKISYVGSNNLNEVFGHWESTGADIVSLWIDSPLIPKQSGIANIMTSVSTDFAPYAVSVVDWWAATHRLSFDHEIAHNFGARHDWAQDTSNEKPYTFNHGYIDVPSKQGSIMAYESTCLLLGFWCNRTVYWSDPEVPPPGSMGVPIGSFLAAYNAHALWLSAPTVASFDAANQALVGCCINVGTFWNAEWRPGPCP